MDRYFIFTITWYLILSETHYKSIILIFMMDPTEVGGNISTRETDSLQLLHTYIIMYEPTNAGINNVNYHCMLGGNIIVTGVHLYPF